MPEKGGGYPDQRAVREIDLALLNGVDGGFADHDLMETSLDKSTCDVLQLLTSLNKQTVTLRDLDSNSPAGVTCPDM